MSSTIIPPPFNPERKMAVTFPTHVLQRIDQDAQRWMNQARSLLDAGEYEILQHKVRNSVVSFGTFTKPVFLYSGATFSPIKTLLRDLFSANRQVDANVLMRAFEGVEVCSPAIGFYTLAILSIKGADLTVHLTRCLPAVQRMLVEEKEYFRSEHDAEAIWRLGFLEEKANLLQGALELQSIMNH